MKPTLSKYNKFQLTYPFEGTKVYKSKSLTKAIKKCYKEFKHLNDINEGIFAVTNLNNEKEYHFQVKQNKLLKFKQKGGDIENIKKDYNDIKEDAKQYIIDKINELGEQRTAKKVYPLEQSYQIEHVPPAKHIPPATHIPTIKHKPPTTHIPIIKHKNKKEITPLKKTQVKHKIKPLLPKASSALKIGRLYDIEDNSLILPKDTTNLSYKNYKPLECNELNKLKDPTPSTIYEAAKSCEQAYNKYEKIDKKVEKYNQCIMI